ncbi:MAG TPA: DUF4845 domain-containing protein [Burkholderiales bacterium]|nr:DUF4845 domain-containing protein [Burkholderiales bacterium]
MRKNQTGISLISLLMILAVLIVVIVIGMKLAPSYIEFYAVKKAVIAVGAEGRGGAPVNQIRRDFDARATIDAIDSVKGSDLEITKDSDGVLVSVAYRKEIPLVSNIGIHIDFVATSKE